MVQGSSASGSGSSRLTCHMTAHSPSSGSSGASSSILAAKLTSMAKVVLHESSQAASQRCRVSPARRTSIEVKTPQTSLLAKITLRATLKSASGSSGNLGSHTG